MDITPTTTANSTKSPEHDSTTTTTITKALSFSNGVLKRRRHHHTPTVVVSYKECLKNHAATLGGHALDGCGEFMPSPSATAADPSSIKCAACGCHRNFHRREPEEPPLPISSSHVIEYHPHHRHHPPPPFSNRSPNSASPPPISSSYMLLALSSAPPETPGGAARKRVRTKFSQEQKEKMQRFAERVGWKMQKRDEDLVQELCSEIGVDRTVLKVWMHNNKNTLAKRDGSNGIGNGSNDHNNNTEINGDGTEEDEDPNHHVGGDVNGSPSSS